MKPLINEPRRPPGRCERFKPHATGTGNSNSLAARVACSVAVTARWTPENALAPNRR
jgi:hypothetical protein